MSGGVVTPKVMACTAHAFSPARSHPPEQYGAQASDADDEEDQALQKGGGQGILVGDLRAVGAGWGRVGDSGRGGGVGWGRETASCSSRVV